MNLMNFAYNKQTLFVLIFGTLVFVGFHEHENSTVNYKRGLLAAILLFIAQGSMSQSRSSFTKGHETLWRAASRLTVVYLLLLIFIFYHTADDARQLLKHLDPELGKPERRVLYSLDECDCNLNWRDFRENFDHFYVLDFIGWFFFTLFVRDAYCLHAFSLLNKLFEISWQYQIPNFYKCWWHHLIIDLICNRGLATKLGLFFAKKCGLRELDWFGRQGKKSWKGWNIFKNHRRFGGFWALFVFTSTGMLWDFYLMKNLWIHDSRHFIKRFRYLIWLILGATGIGELSDDIETFGTEKRRQVSISNEYRWVACGTLVLEIAISLKFTNDVEYCRFGCYETPLYIPAFWGLGCVAIMVHYLYLRLKRNRVTLYGDTIWEIEAREKENAEKEKEKIIEEENKKKEEEQKLIQKSQKKSFKEKLCREKLKKFQARENGLREIQEEDSSDEESSEDSSEEWSESSEENSPLRFKL